MTDSLLASFGVYGGALIIAFVAGLFPIVSIELFIIGVSSLRAPSIGSLALLIVLAGIGHQIAKTITYYAGAGAFDLPHGRVKQRIDRARARVERWNRRPKLILFLASTVGLPPLYLIGLIAKPLMKIEIIPFTLLSFFGRLGRFATLAAIPFLF